MPPKLSSLAAFHSPACVPGSRQSRGLGNPCLTLENVTWLQCSRGPVGSAFPGQVWEDTDSPTGPAAWRRAAVCGERTGPVLLEAECGLGEAACGRQEKLKL